MSRFKNAVCPALGLSGIRRRCSGATLVEVAIVVAASGLLAALATGLLSQWSQRRDKESAATWLVSAEQSLVRYMLEKHRAPCVDISGDGFEDRDAQTGACAATASAGGFPYATLNMNLPPLPSGYVVRYGVWRASGGDLTQSAQAFVTDAVQDVDGGIEFLKRTVTAAKSTAAADQPTVAGNDAQGPRSACISSDVQPAMVVAVQPEVSGSASCFVRTRGVELVSIGRLELLGLLFTANAQ